MNNSNFGLWKHMREFENAIGVKREIERPARACGAGKRNNEFWLTTVRNVPHAVEEHRVASDINEIVGVLGEQKNR